MTKRQRISTCRLKRILQKLNAGALDKVSIRVKESIKELANKKEIENTIYKEN